MSEYAEEGFDSFWNAYPKKRSKGDAYKAWKATKDRRPTMQKLLKAIAVLKASEDWRKDGGQYIPYPSTWLRAWGWEDVPEVDMQGVVNGKMWWETVSGVEKKAKELGVPAWCDDRNYEGETWQDWARRVRKIAESTNVIPITRAA
jgi:hypothetical protein